MLAYECLIKTKSNVFPMIVHAETEGQLPLTKVSDLQTLV